MTDIAIESIILDCAKFCEEHVRPRLKSVWFHPDDYAELERVVREVAIYPAADVLPIRLVSALWIDGVTVYKDACVERGKPWYDPPEGAP